MSKLLRLALSLSLVAGVVAVNSLQATTLEKMNVPELIKDSEAAARVRVVDVDTTLLEDGEMVHTIASLEVVESYRGSLPYEISVRVPGGEFGTQRIVIDGMPEFREGHELLVFLTRWDDGAYKVLGYVQGLSEIRTVNGKVQLVGGRAHGRELAALAREIRAGGPQTVDLKPVR